MTYATLPALAIEVLSWLPPMTIIDKYAIAERLYLAGITKYKGTMTAAQQRAFFGRYIFGKKCMVIDNDMGYTVQVSRTVCFGTDWEESTFTFERIAEIASHPEKPFDCCGRYFIKAK